MNGDDNEPLSQSPPRPGKTYTGVSPFSNPFVNIVHNTQGNAARPIGKSVESALKKEHHAFQTPQRKPRPFRTPNRDRASTLSPYINLLRGSGVASAPVAQLCSHDIQQSRVPPQPPSSPLQEQWAGEGAKSSQDTPVFPNERPTDENAFEELREAYKTVSGQNKKIEALQYQIITLKNGRNSIAREHAQTSQELEGIRARMGEMSAKLSSLQSQLERSDATMNAKVQELTKADDVVKVKTEENAQLIAKLQKVSTAMEKVEAAYSQEAAKGESLSARVVDANRRIQDLVEAYGVMDKNLYDLGNSHETHRRRTDESLKNAAELRKLTSRALEEVENKNCNQGSLGDIRTALAELRDHLLDSHQVNDLLRNKLFDATAQLAEANGRVGELEKEKRDIWERSLQSVSQTAQIQDVLSLSERRAIQLSENLRNLEAEGATVLAQSAELEAKMEQVAKQNKDLDVELRVLRPLQQAKLQLQAEVADLTRRLTEETATRIKLQAGALETKDALISAEKEAFVLRSQVQDTMSSRSEVALELSKLKIAHKQLETDLSSTQETFRAREKELQALSDDRLSTAQEIIHKQNQEAAASKADFEWSENQREQLRAALSQEQTISTRLQQELKETGIRELIATAKVDMHEAKIASLTREIETKEGLLRQLSTKVGTVQERYEAQASTLRLTKEELGEMHEKLANVNALNQEAQAAHRAEVTVLHEKKSSLSATIDKLDQAMKTQEVVALERTRDLQAVVRGLQKETQQLGETKVERESAIKHEIANLKEREDVLKMKVTDLQSTIAQLETSKRDEADASLAFEKQAALELEAKVKALVEEKEEIIERQRTFRERYQAGTLSDIEKDLVFMLVQHAEDLHEQASVAKDNEIKRRDAAIAALHTRIAELELSLARAFHPDGVLPDLSTILNLKITPVGVMPAEQMLASLVMSTTPPPNDTAMAPIPVPPDFEDTMDILSLTSLKANSTHDLDGLLPPASQMPSELSTPPQSPTPKVKAKAFSFVQLSNEDSEAEKENEPPFARSTKRTGEMVPVPEVAPSKKRLRAAAVKRGNQQGNTAPEPTGRGRQKKRKAGTT